jgi:hypothetical protein
MLAALGGVSSAYHLKKMLEWRAYEQSRVLEAERLLRDYQFRCSAADLQLVACSSCVFQSAGRLPCVVTSSRHGQLGRSRRAWLAAAGQRGSAVG